MNINHFAIKPLFCAFYIVMTTLLVACSDSGSNSDTEATSKIDKNCDDDFCDNDGDGKSADKNSNATESSSSFQKKEANISASSYKDSSLTGFEYESNLGTLNIVKGIVYDSVYSREYKTLQVGPYTWIVENLEYATTAFENYDMCYDNDSDNCKTDGRLFRNYTKNNMCPTGFVVPSSADYRYLTKITKTLTDASLGFNPQMAGFCKRGTYDKDSLGCSDKGKKSYLLTNNDSMFTIDASGKPGMKESVFYGFYSLRCVKKSAFVDNEKQLPICNAETEEDWEDIFVASEGKNYSCSDGKWVKGDNDKCSWGSRGELHYYGNSLFVCNGSWSLATMTETGATCSNENENEVRELNDKKFICKDSSWRLLNAIEKSIGLCTPKNIGTIDTIPANDTLEYYYCDSTGWRTAKLVDYVGKCDESKYYNITEFNNKNYVCRTSNNWTEFTTLEDEIGVCTPKNRGVIDSLPYNETYNNYYYCDSTGWRTAKLIDYAGVCEDSKFYMTVTFNTVKYGCRTDSTWTTLSSLESEIGICSPKNRGVFDTTEAAFYKCDSTDWRTAKIEDYYECTKAKVNSTVEYRGNTYGCADDLKWKLLDTLTKTFGFCTSSNYAVIKEHNGKNYICDSGWRLATKNDLIGLCNDSTQNTTKVYHDTTFGCDNGIWRTLKLRESNFGMCTKKTPDKVIADNGYYYKCNGSSWVSISITDGLGECTADNAYRKTGEIYVFAGGAYYCNTSKWEHAYASQVLGACNSDRKAEIGMVGDTAYICNGEKDWLLAAGLENEYGLCTDNTTRITFNGEKYGCVGESGIYRWRAEDDLDQTLGFCNGSGLQIKTYNNLEYVCSRKHDAWFTGKFDEMFESCSSALYGTEITFQGETYYCGDGTFTAGERRNFWHQLGSLEKEIGVCTKDKVGESASASSLTCTCKYNPGDPQNNWPYSYFWQCD